MLKHVTTDSNVRRSWLELRRMGHQKSWKSFVYENNRLAKQVIKPNILDRH